LNIYPVNVPPLRERREDIEALANEFLREVGLRLNKRFDAISPQALAALQRYDWPGNVRELQNIIQRAAVMTTGRVLQLPEEWKLSVEPKKPDGGFTASMENVASKAEKTFQSD
jgi:transcriptional regulator with PAS, ATPase and Fis domain